MTSFPRARSHHPRRAFSLIELAVVLIVVAVIAAIAIPTFQSFITVSDANAAEAEVNATMRNALAIARANDRLVPTPADVATAFSEISAAAPGVGAIAAGDYDVCDVDAPGYATCVTGAPGTVVNYDAGSGSIGIAVEATPRVLAQVVPNDVLVWTSDTGTATSARLYGPAGPQPVAFTADTFMGTIVDDVTDVSVSITSATPTAGGVATPAVLVGPYGADKAAYCADITITETVGQVFVANCPGSTAAIPDAYFETLLPLLAGLGVTDVEQARAALTGFDDDPDAPPAISCLSAPCSFRVSVGGQSFDLASASPNSFGTTAEAYSGTYTSHG